MSTRARMRRAGAAFAAAALLFAAPVHGHGGEEEALEKMPARALAQQALALLAQKGKAVEAHERVEAALRSRAQADVDMRALRGVRAAFEAGDHRRAAALLNRALAEPEPPASREPGTKQGSPADGSEMPRGDDMAGSAARALDHRPEFRPERALAEWVAVGAGLLALGAALAVLGGPRRRQA